MQTHPHMRTGKLELYFARTFSARFHLHDFVLGPVVCSQKCDPASGFALMGRIFMQVEEFQAVQHVDATEGQGQQPGQRADTTDHGLHHGSSPPDSTGGNQENEKGEPTSQRSGGPINDGNRSRRSFSDEKEIFSIAVANVGLFFALMEQG